MTLTIEDLKSGKVRLEFGNTEHIALVRQYEREQNSDELQLKKYRVSLYFTGAYDVDVKAKNEKEAKELAKEESISDFDINDVIIESIEELEE